jgi:arginase
VLFRFVLFSFDEVSLVGIPLDIGKDNVGTDEGPDHLRKNGLLEMLTFLKADYKDLGNIPCPTREKSVMGDKRAKYLEPIAETCKKVAKMVNKELDEERIVVALGGDHSLAMGTISGASVACKGDLGVIWIDAHADMHTTQTTISGNVHGMPSSAVMGYGHDALVNLHAPGGKIKKENMLYIGLKDLDQAEIDLIRKEQLASVTMMEILHHGLKSAFEQIQKLQERVKHIWVSLDLDAIDVAYAPGTPMPNYGGFTYREITSLCKYIGKTCQLVGMDIVELAPREDRNDKTTRLAVELVSELLGTEYSSYAQYMAHEEAKQQLR